MNNAFDWLETQLIYSPDPAIFEMVFARKLDEALKTEGVLDKYKALRNLSAIQSKFKKTAGQRESANVIQMTEELKKLRVSPEVRREETAENAFMQVQKNEEKFANQKRYSAAQREMTRRNLAFQYQNVAQAYPGTDFGKQAQEKPDFFRQKESN